MTDPEKRARLTRALLAIGKLYPSDEEIIAAGQMAEFATAEVELVTKELKALLADEVASHKEIAEIHSRMADELKSSKARIAELERECAGWEGAVKRLEEHRSELISRVAELDKLCAALIRATPTFTLEEVLAEAKGEKSS